MRRRGGTELSPGGGLSAESAVSHSDPMSRELSRTRVVWLCRVRATVRRMRCVRGLRLLRGVLTQRWGGRHTVDSQHAGEGTGGGGAK